MGVHDNRHTFYIHKWPQAIIWTCWKTLSILGKKIRPNLTPLTCSLLLLLLVVRCETRILSVIQVFKSICIGPARWLGLYECLPCHPDSLNFSPGAHSGKRELDLKSYSLTSTLTLCQTPAYTYIHTCPHHLHIQVKFVVRIIYR